jgi:ABC-type Fe3+-hydroxamate transport system substrate-binding protein
MIFTDQLNRKIEIHFPIKRIISLVPSQTELLFYLGLSGSIAGVTKFCIHPKEQAIHKCIIGGTKNFRFDVIEIIEPDLIIGNKEENYPEGIATLAEKYPVWMSDISSLQDALEMIHAVGEITQTATLATGLVSKIQFSLQHVAPRSIKTVVYLIWKSPWMVAGKNTFITSWMEEIGLLNLISAERYPTVSTEQLQQLNPQLVLLSSEPYPFKASHLLELQSLLPQSKIMLVDGEMFSWYGSRMLEAVSYFNSLEL